MRILIDTNVLFSAILFPDGKASKALIYCIQNATIVIPTYVIDELSE